MVGSVGFGALSVGCAAKRRDHGLQSFRAKIDQPVQPRAIRVINLRWPGGMISGKEAGAVTYLMDMASMPLIRRIG